MPTINKGRVPLTVPDGTTMQVHVAYPSNADHLPGILVFQEAFGVTAHIRDITERIAAEGYYAIAPELFHRTAKKGLEFSYSNFESTKPHMQALSLNGLSEDIVTAHKFMSRQNEVDENRTASIGFCMGGRVSFIASTLLPLKAAACFYGSGISDFSEDMYQKINSPLLLCWGGQDKHITKDKIDVVTQRLNSTNKDYINVVFSEADHAFFNNIRSPNYHPASARIAWELVKSTWNEHLK